MTTYKWAVWRRMLHAELACYLVWVLAFQAFVLIFQARLRLPTRPSTGQHGFEVGLGHLSQRDNPLTMSAPPEYECHVHGQACDCMAGCAQDEDVSMSLPELAGTPWGAASLACEALALAGMAPFLYIEATTLREYGLRGWLSTWNVMDVIAYAVQARPPPTLLACISSLKPLQRERAR